ncbi:TIGR03086 family metal-binding protein [Tsukamurella sp. 8F]|uniref:TIGR03086 family metal-binding protein n=1 Tax=unclassified Tsukamurella TaxID=2633480 RepID=UPI0023B9C589|nr:MULTISPECIES: TIGR03086 family metal-binding protein [unclassified Tsukamurella]MDF0529085.1 TIGR03086 family metal-binding protein [Tsukamurella sp. 8J]MDF0587459.1 TIGR03086 family metal-binding protein [Tsukamurella sp. 8F]
MTTTADSPTALDAFRAAEAPLSEIVSSYTEKDWAAPSPCEGWSARDVLAHVIDTEREYFAGHGAALPAPALDDPAAAWGTHAARVRELLADPAIADREFDGHFGRTTVGALFRAVYVFDVVAHRWDLARAAGRDERFTDSELDTLEHGVAAFGDALYSDGVCRPGVSAPDGADRQARLLAALGRAEA